MGTPQEQPAGAAQQGSQVQGPVRQIVLEMWRKWCSHTAGRRKAWRVWCVCSHIQAAPSDSRGEGAHRGAQGRESGGVEGAWRGQPGPSVPPAKRAFGWYSVLTSHVLTGVHRGC